MCGVLGPVLLGAALLGAPPLPAALGVGPSLSAAASASARPPECRSASRRAAAHGPNVWEAARQPALPAYCDLLARAHTELSTSPKEAKASAEAAEKILPGHAATAIVKARAALALGAPAEAAAEFDKARAIDPRSIEDAPAMRDLGRTLLKTGKLEEALAVYRALVPRVELLGTSAEQVTALLEAAHASMASAASKGGKISLDEAIAYLREARLRPVTEMTGQVHLSLALVLDRAGEPEEAEGALVEAQRAGIHKGAVPYDYAATAEDRQALLALGTEHDDRPFSQKTWEGYLAGPGGKGPWAAEARARLERVKKGGGKAAPLPKAPGKKR